MSASQLDTFLKDEYLLLQNQYEDFDRRSLTIKSWVSGAAIAAIALGADGTKNPSGMVWLAIAFIAICIWYLEGRWKMFQYACRGRIEQIEAHFRGQAPEPLVPFQSFDVWFKHYQSTPFLGRLAKAMWQDFVFIPYLPLVFVSLAFFFCLG